jgi:hypothetical protein
MKTRYSILFMFFATFLNAQIVVDFEEFDLPVDTFLNGSDGSGGYSTNGVLLANNYNAEFRSWTGWAISSTTDTLTPGFMNQYSAIPGSGVDGSTTYAVSYSFGPNILRLENEMAGRQVEGLYITNGTYPYLSMRDGDGFAKKFGGASGEEPDFFLLTIKGYLEGALLPDSVNFYLADYRFEDNSQDYIVDEWTFVDVSSLGAVDSLAFSLSSSDVGQFGINTPTFFCIDNIQIGNLVSSSEELLVEERLVEVFPNPAADFIQIHHDFDKEVNCALFDMSGRLILQKILQNRTERMDLQALRKGTYILVLNGEEYRISKLIVKQ